MATKMTKAQLLDENNALRNEINTLRLLVANAEHAAQAQADAARTRTLLDEHDLEAIGETHAERVQRSAPAPRTQYVMPAWQVQRAAAMAAAKQAAMGMRCVVRVEA